jgi:capsular exopolysaccharide synthesis family protein
MDFWRTVEILGKRKWLLLLSVLVTAGLTFLATRLVGSKYQASVRFVTPANSPLTNPNGAEIASDDMTVARSQAAIYEAVLKTRDVLEPALRKLSENQVPPDLLNNIDFKAIGPRLFELQVTDGSPARAQVLANALADSFVEKNRNIYTQKATDVVKLLERQMQDADSRLNAARQRYEGYRRSHGVVTNLNDQLSPALYRLQAARQKRDDAQEQVADARARLTERVPELAKMPATVPVERAPSDSPLVKGLEDELAQIEKQLTTLRAKYTDQTIEVRQATATRDALQSRLKQEQGKQPKVVTQQVNPDIVPVRRAVRELKQEIKGYEAQMVALNTAVKQAEAEIHSYTGVDGPMAAMAEEMSTQNQSRANLQARLHAARMAMDVAQRENPLVAMDQVDEFNPPVNLTTNRTVKIVFLAALCAFLATAGLIIGVDTVDPRLRTVREAEMALPAPVVTAIPQPIGAVTPSSLPRVTELMPLSMHSEAYRFLGLQLLTDRNPPVRSVMVLAAKAEQGSTSTVTNLGITLAQAGHRVVIVDANLRTPELHQIFELRNEVGLTNLLSGATPEMLDQALQPTGIANLTAITSGPPCGNPWELFRSAHLTRLSELLKERFDYVLYDTPSAIAFTDAINLSPVVDAAFLCVRALEPVSGGEQRLIQMLEQAHVPVLGSVLNDVPATVLESCQTYQRYYPLASASGALPSGYVAEAVAEEGGPVIQVIEAADDDEEDLPGRHEA